MGEGESPIVGTAETKDGGVTKIRIHGSTDCRTGGLIIENVAEARERMKSQHSSGIFYILQLITAIHSLNFNHGSPWVQQ